MRRERRSMISKPSSVSRAQHSALILPTPASSDTAGEPNSTTQTEGHRAISLTATEGRFELPRGAFSEPCLLKGERAFDGAETRSESFAVRPDRDLNGGPGVGIVRARRESRGG